MLHGSPIVHVVIVDRKKINNKHKTISYHNYIIMWDNHQLYAMIEMSVNQ